MMTLCNFPKVVIDRLALFGKKTDLKRMQLNHAGNIPIVIIADDTIF